MTGAGAGVPGSEADLGSGETTGRKGEGAFTTVLVAMLVASLKPESLVSSMTSSGRGGASGRTRVCAARTSSLVALRWAGGLDGGYGMGFLDLEPVLVRVVRDTVGNMGAKVMLASSKAPEVETIKDASTSMNNCSDLGMAASVR